MRWLCKICRTCDDAKYLEKKSWCSGAQLHDWASLVSCRPSWKPYQLLDDKLGNKMVQVALLINDEHRGQFHFDVVVVVVKSFALLVFFLHSTVAGGGGGGRVQFSITYTLVVTHPIVMGMIISISVGLFFFFPLSFFPSSFLRSDRLWESRLARIPHMDYSTERDQWAVLSRTREITCTASKVWLAAPTILSWVSLNRRSSFTSDYRSSRWSIPIELPGELL